MLSPFKSVYLVVVRVFFFRFFFLLAFVDGANRKSTRTLLTHNKKILPHKTIWLTAVYCLHCVACSCPTPVARVDGNGVRVFEAHGGYDFTLRAKAEKDKRMGWKGDEREKEMEDENAKQNIKQ